MINYITSELLKYGIFIHETDIKLIKNHEGTENEIYIVKVFNCIGTTRIRRDASYAKDMSILIKCKLRNKVIMTRARKSILFKNLSKVIQYEDTINDYLDDDGIFDERRNKHQSNNRRL